MEKSLPNRLGELARLFFKLGVIGFGRPVAHIAMIEDEVVKRRRWLTREHFLDLLGATNLIPGPNSTEMAIHAGYVYAGWLGLIVSGAAFIGYIIAGIPGAVVATLGIFIPSFLFTALLNPLVPLLRSSKWTSAFLDAVNVGAVALMFVVTLQLGIATFKLSQAPFIDFLAVAIAIGSTVLAIRYKINAAWLVLGGALIGWGGRILI